jgi:hypothetical protein
MPEQFVPRNYLVAPSLFGQTSLANWSPWDSQDEASVARAWLQHRFVERVRVAIEEDLGGVANFALTIGARERTVAKKLGGHLPIGLDDLLSWPMALGADKYPAIEDRSDFLPPPELVRTDAMADVLPMARSSEGS